MLMLNVYHLEIMRPCKPARNGRAKVSFLIFGSPDKKQMESQWDVSSESASAHQS